MKKILLLIAALMAIHTLYAQGATSKDIALTDIANNVYRARKLSGIKPMSDGVHYAKINADHTQILKYSFKTGKQVAVLFDVATARNCNLKSFDDFIFSPDESQMLIQTETKPIYRRSFTAIYYLFNLKNNKMEPLSTGGPQQVPIFSPDGNQIAFVRDNNIYLVKLLFGNAESQVTKDGEYNKVLNGVPDWVYEEEFGYNRAFDFSADSKMIAYVRFDESKVKQYSFPLYKGLSPEKSEFAAYPGAYTYKYPKAGFDNSKVSVHTFDIKSRVTRKVNLPIDSTSYIPRIQFTPDAEKLAIVTLNRHQNRMDLYMANPRSGISKLAIRDESEQYIKETAYSDLTFYPNHIVMMSERDGYNHLYLYTMQGNLVRQLTKGKFEVRSFYGWNPKTNETYYAANEGNPTETNIYKVDAKGRVTALTQESGVSSAVFSTNFEAFIQTFSSLNTPSVVTLNDARGRKVATLYDNSELKAQLKMLKPSITKELFTFKTADGVSLNGWMVRPTHLEKGKKYPVIMYQYSGPGSQQVLNQWEVGAFRDGAMFEGYLVQNGFIAVCVDGRGTGGRGAAFEKCTYLQLGVKEANDQVETAKYLATLPYVDAKNIGIWGWSFGGYMTIMSMSQGTPVFKAGVAVAAPTDWRFYDSVYTERFMRTPQENAEGYDAASAFKRIDRLSGRLLLVHGTADDNVHLQNMAEYAEALVQADKQFDMQVYTNRNHSIFGGNTRLHLMTRITEFFENNLK